MLVLTSGTPGLRPVIPITSRGGAITFLEHHPLGASPIWSSTLRIQGSRTHRLVHPLLWSLVSKLVSRGIGKIYASDNKYAIQSGVKDWTDKYIYVFSYIYDHALEIVRYIAIQVSILLFSHLKCLTLQRHSKNHPYWMLSSTLFSWFTRLKYKLVL